MIDSKFNGLLKWVGRPTQQRLEIFQGRLIRSTVHPTVCSLFL
jgi:hypothetical protein